LTFTASNFEGQQLSSAIDFQGVARNALIKNCVFTNLGSNSEVITDAGAAVRFLFISSEDALLEEIELLQEVTIEDCIIKVSKRKDDALIRCVSSL
jgi:hypothetical protein